jgi:GNAT superfamily N-acetyltransferase
MKTHSTFLFLGRTNKILKIELIVINNGYESRDAEIRQRISSSSKGKRTRQFIAQQDSLEIGFASMDEIPEMSCLALCELFVPTQLRGFGLGRLLLKMVEARALAQGYEQVTLSPSPLELEFPAERLVDWYKRQGYTERTGCPTELEKKIQAIQSP